MVKELTEYFLPEKILYREEQIKQIKKVFDTFNNFQIGSNLIIRGVTGSGKTTVIKKVMNGEKNVLFASGSTTITSFKTLKALFDIKCLTIEKLITEAINKLKKNPRILVIDELNKIREIKELFNILNTIYRETNCPIILISNDLTLVNEIPEDARLTLFFEKVDFPAYNAIELKGIIQDRLNLIKRDLPEIPEGALEFICAIAGKEGSARVALNITMKCILSDDFSHEYIESVRKTLEIQDWKDFIQGLIPTEKEFLKVLLNICSQKGSASSSEILIQLKKFTPSRISQLTDTFEHNYGLIKSEHKNLGRGGGKIRLISFASEEIYQRLDFLIGY